MLLRELTDPLNEKQVWARKGTTLVRKYRCMGGIRKGRVVASPTQCFAPVDVKQRALMKRTRSRLGAKMSRKSKKTKKTNPASIRLNKGKLNR
jgi:hypothetical protein|tara:strand:- start:1116 stop:1394 length:279 start_codon:yes stop_codon:yes gene_type:complete